MRATNRLSGHIRRLDAVTKDGEGVPAIENCGLCFDWGLGVPNHLNDFFLQISVKVVDIMCDYCRMIHMELHNAARLKEKHDGNTKAIKS